MSFLQNVPTLRSFLEAMARNKSFVRKLPNGTAIYVSPDSQLKYLFKEFDRDLIQLADRFVRENSVVWDIGANCGVFAFCSIGAKQVVAVEADPFLITLLQKSNARNQGLVQLVSAAVSSTAELASFSIVQRGRASNHLSDVQGNSQTGGERSRLFMQTITLDSLLERFASPTIVKIDVEGAEVMVLKGASKLLRDIRPIIYLETVDDTHAACRDILQLAGYNIELAAEMNWLCIPKII